MSSESLEQTQQPSSVPSSEPARQDPAQGLTIDAAIGFSRDGAREDAGSRRSEVLEQLALHNRQDIEDAIIFGVDLVLHSSQTLARAPGGTAAAAFEAMQQQHRSFALYLEQNERRKAEILREWSIIVALIQNYCATGSTITQIDHAAKFTAAAGQCGLAGNPAAVQALLQQIEEVRSKAGGASGNDLFVGQQAQSRPAQRGPEREPDAARIAREQKETQAHLTRCEEGVHKLAAERVQHPERVRESDVEFAALYREAAALKPGMERYLFHVAQAAILQAQTAALTKELAVCAVQAADHEALGNNGPRRKDLWDKGILRKYEGLFASHPEVRAEAERRFTSSYEARLTLRHAARALAEQCFQAIDGIGCSVPKLENALRRASETPGLMPLVMEMYQRSHGEGLREAIASQWLRASNRNRLNALMHKAAPPRSEKFEVINLQAPVALDAERKALLAPTAAPLVTSRAMALGEAVQAATGGELLAHTRGVLARVPQPERGAVFQEFVRLYGTSFRAAAEARLMSLEGKAEEKAEHKTTLGQILTDRLGPAGEQQLMLEVVQDLSIARGRIKGETAEPGPQARSLDQDLELSRRRIEHVTRFCFADQLRHNPELRAYVLGLSNAAEVRGERHEVLRVLDDLSAQIGQQRSAEPPSREETARISELEAQRRRYLEAHAAAIANPVPFNVNGHPENFSAYLEQSQVVAEKRGEKDRHAVDEAARKARQAMVGGWTGWGTDEQAVYDACKGLSAEQRRMFEARYRVISGGVSFEAQIRSDFSGTELDRVQCLLHGDRAGAEAAELAGCMIGMGTNTQGIADVLRTVSRDEERAEIARTFQQRYGHYYGSAEAPASLIDSIKAETSGDDMVRLTAYAEGRELAAQAAEIHAELDATVRIDRSRIGDILEACRTAEGTLDKEKLSGLEREYQRQYGVPLREHLMKALGKSAEASWFTALLEGNDVQAAAYRARYSIWGAGTDEAHVKGAFRAPQAILNISDPQKREEQLAQWRERNQRVVECYERMYGGEGALTRDLAGDLNNADLIETQSLIACGQVSLAEEVFCSVEGLGTDPDRLRSCFANRSRAEVFEAAVEYEHKFGKGAGAAAALEAQRERALAGGESFQQFLAATSMFAALQGDLSGDEWFDVSEMARGIPETPREMMAAVERRYRHEHGGWLDGWFDNAERQRLDREVAHTRAQYTQLCEQDLHESQSSAAMAQMDVCFERCGDAAHAYRARKNAVADTVVNTTTTVVVIAGGVTATMVTGGAGAVLLVAGCTALASLGARAGTRYAIRGWDGYGMEAFAQDGAFAAVDGLTAGLAPGANAVSERLVVGVGTRMVANRAGAAAQQFALGKLLYGNTAKTMITFAVRGGTEGAMIAGGNAFAHSTVDFRTWENGFAEGLVTVGEVTFVATVAGGGFGAVSGAVAGLMRGSGFIVEASQNHGKDVRLYLADRGTATQIKTIANKAGSSTEMCYVRLRPTMAPGNSLTLQNQVTDTPPQEHEERRQKKEKDKVEEEKQPVVVPHEGRKPNLIADATAAAATDEDAAGERARRGAAQSYSAAPDGAAEEIPTLPIEGVPAPDEEPEKEGFALSIEPQAVAIQDAASAAAGEEAGGELPSLGDSATAADAPRDADVEPADTAVPAGSQAGDALASSVSSVAEAASARTSLPSSAIPSVGVLPGAAPISSFTGGDPFTASPSSASAPDPAVRGSLAGDDRAQAGRGFGERGRLAGAEPSRDIASDFLHVLLGVSDGSSVIASHLDARREAECDLQQGAERLVQAAAAAQAQGRGIAAAPPQSQAQAQGAAAEVQSISEPVASVHLAKSRVSHARAADEQESESLVRSVAYRDAAAAGHRAAGEQRHGEQKGPAHTTGEASAAPVAAREANGAADAEGRGEAAVASSSRTSRRARPDRDAEWTVAKAAKVDADEEKKKDAGVDADAHAGKHDRSDVVSAAVEDTTTVGTHQQDEENIARASGAPAESAVESAANNPAQLRVRRSSPPLERLTALVDRWDAEEKAASRSDAAEAGSSIERAHVRTKFTVQEKETFGSVPSPAAEHQAAANRIGEIGAPAAARVQTKAAEHSSAGNASIVPGVQHPRQDSSRGELQGQQAINRDPIAVRSEARSQHSERRPQGKRRAVRLSRAEAEKRLESLLDQMSEALSAAKRKELLRSKRYDRFLSAIDAELLAEFSPAELRASIERALQERVAQDDREPGAAKDALAEAESDAEEVPAEPVSQGLGMTKADVYRRLKEMRERGSLPSPRTRVVQRSRAELYRAVRKTGSGKE